MSKRNSFAREMRENKTVIRLLERVYLSLHKLGFQHYDLLDREEERFVEDAEVAVIALLKRRNRDWGPK